MAIPNEKLQQLLQEISSKAAFAEQQLGIVRAQIASKNREQRMLQLSNTEMNALPQATPVYEGVGKMFVSTTIPDVKKKQDQEGEDCKKELSNLDKKLHYLETTYKNSTEHIESILKRVDSGIPYNASSGSDAVYGGAKIMSFNQTTREHLRTYTIPQGLLAYGMNANDVRINNTLGPNGVALLSAVRRLFNTSVVKADEDCVGSYDGELIYCWNGTQKSFLTNGADGITLASGNLYWSVLTSKRSYYAPQAVLIDTNFTDVAVLAAVQDPGHCASEQAGLAADNKGQIYICASEQNAIYYVDKQQSQVHRPFNGDSAGGSGPWERAGHSGELRDRDLSA
ncbi:hypothetical protein B0A50_03042 [Salinomyces thailandicus]|uniref:Uncharacterized protein n=1 Tax=Salinomyces thailandicus TaxID=706561 RepID=A0A4U0U1W7_9PEZI|nr:hypothetical protein B0A50_03042 [Salinomyces thailandica]